MRASDTVVIYTLIRTAKLIDVASLPCLCSISNFSTSVSRSRAAPAWKRDELGERTSSARHDHREVLGKGPINWQASKFAIKTMPLK
jgi:hypothetical protein